MYSSKRVSANAAAAVSKCSNATHAVDATLGLFLIRAADPAAHRSLIWFTIVSSVVHAAVMTVQAAGDPPLAGHPFGDVPMLLAAALVLGWLGVADTRAAVVVHG